MRFALCLTSLAGAPLIAHAYIDPGSGSLLFQSLLAVLFGIGVAFRQLRQWLAQMWSVLLRRQPPERDEPRQ